jgi:hypothetical protein
MIYHGPLKEGCSNIGNGNFLYIRNSATIYFFLRYNGDSSEHYSRYVNGYNDI